MRSLARRMSEFHGEARVRSAAAWRRALVCGAAACALAAAVAVPAARAEDAAKLDRPAIEAIVKDYLLQHPEVIEDAINVLQERRATAEAEKQRQAVSANSDAILSAPQNAVLGNPKGDVTLVEFFDYNCGYCKRALPDMLGLINDDKKLKVVLKDYPILSPGSIEAASVAIAVKKQIQGDKFLEFHKELLASRGQVGKDRALEVAKDVGIDMKKLQADMAEQGVRTAIGENLRLGDTLGVSGTPSYILAGEVVSGAIGYDALKAKIDAVRQCGKTLC
ncbi:DsbA family protein [Labrys wisconsinensis]|uniref:Protein-disulfide isomerase n=1 Tax=Labrys wisconsinensis TaxID=425677 RepID=A0ABU0J6X0_9HYPH|nr:DsbA family protein [Labrys wisconsinensis]MDQ0469380.1 protein-disulfide isomerase [Labrys wisconsinensis]